jgi:hypothetical protein
MFLILLTQMTRPIVHLFAYLFCELEFRVTEKKKTKFPLHKNDCL